MISLDELQIEPAKRVFGRVAVCDRASVAIGGLQLSSLLPHHLLIMDTYNPGSSRQRRLTKEPPPSNSAYTNMNPNAASNFQRQPPSSQSPASSNESQTPSFHSNSSLDRSPHPATSQPSEIYNNRFQHPSRQSCDDPDEFNAHPGTLSALDSTKASGYQNSLRRPGPPPLSYTTPNSKMMSPSLRQSASFSIGDRTVNATPPDTDSVSISSSKRYSDEAGKISTPWKKKSGISSFIGSVLGSPRSNSVKISAPENPVHVTHVGFDNETGQFTVCARQLFISHPHASPFGKPYLSFTPIR